MEEADQKQRPYSVLTIDEVKEKITKQIDEISEIFWISKSDATVLLMHFRWNSLKVSERLSEDKEKLLTDSGLRSVLMDLNQNSSCGICDYVGDDDVELVSTPCCSHEFCVSCWGDYLDKCLERNETVNVITCPKQDCSAAVGLETIEKLTGCDQEVYEECVLRSYTEGNKTSMIKLCPAWDCNYAIEFREDGSDNESSLNVVCLCGHTFCWRCKLESHIPVTCNNASIWLSTKLKELKAEVPKLSLYQRSSKPCPKCSSPVSLIGRKHGRFLTCDTGSCSFTFCSKCFVDEKLHRENSGLYGACNVQEKVMKAENKMACVERWEAEKISMEDAEYDLKAFDEFMIENPSLLKERDIRIVREGYMLVVQCRQVLKWSCAYEHFHTEYEISKKEYLRYLQQIANITLQNYLKTLVKETEGASDSFEKLCHFRYMVTTATSNIGNFFYHFSKALQNGLVDVKVKSYSNEAGPCWFCDRCTYGNSWLDRNCKMCCDSTTSRVEDWLRDLSLT